jgi:serine/threonine protein kinase
MCELVERAGTSRFMAPEVIMHKSYRYECDIWSLGCTLLQAGTNKLPYHECSSMFEVNYQLCTGHAPKIPAGRSVDAEFRAFLGQCLQVDMNLRRSMHFLYQVRSDVTGVLLE